MIEAMFFATGRRVGHRGRIEFAGGARPFQPACTCTAVFPRFAAPFAAEAAMHAHLNWEG